MWLAVHAESGGKGRTGLVFDGKLMSGLVSADLRTELVPIVVVQDQEGVSAASGIGQKDIVIRHGRAADGDAFPIELQRYGAAALRDTQVLHPSRWQSTR